jgi:hypothetical protein
MGAPCNAYYGTGQRTPSHYTTGRRGSGPAGLRRQTIRPTDRATVRTVYCGSPSHSDGIALPHR